MANGLPVEGRAAGPCIGDLARLAPTCRLTDSVGKVREQLARAGKDTCIVVDNRGVVLGRLSGEVLTGDPEEAVENVMEPGPSTFRPNVPLLEMAEYMQRHKLDDALVTTSDGRFVGVVKREEVEEAVRRSRREEVRARP